MTWVHKSDGRLVPFEADRISHDMFTATERLGKPDAFLARELTDSILHFLSQETEGSIPTTAQVAEVVVKVVRELGHPLLAQAFAQRSVAACSALPTEAEPSSTQQSRLGPSVAEVEQLLSAPSGPTHAAWELSRACLSSYSLQAVFSRDLVRAHADGLLILGNLDSPLELAGFVLEASQVDQDGLRLAELVLQARGTAGDYVVLDSPEYGLSGAAGVEFTQQLLLGLRATGLKAIINLNTDLPPPGARDVTEGPLFAAQRQPITREERAPQAEALLESLLAQPLDNISGQLRVDWHLNQGDFDSDQSQPLLRVAKRAIEETVTFVFDRPRRPILLAEGLDRQNHATLMTIGLNLPRLAEQPAVAGQPDLFLKKLGSLVRLAVSAAIQKRDFLRRHISARPNLGRGFLLDRARLVLVPVGLEAVGRRYRNENLCAGGAGLQFARQIIVRLGEAVRQESHHRSLDICIDSADRLVFGTSPDDQWNDAQVAGLTPWDPQASWQQQLRAAGQLHAETKTGTAAILMPSGQALSSLPVVDVLRQAWQQGDIARLRFVRPVDPPRQLPALWRE
jgi:hypothetical protein